MKVQRTKKGNLIVQSKYDFNCAVMGMILGDGCLNRFRLMSKGPKNRSKKGPLWNRTELRIAHKADHREYLDWKISLINAYIDDVSIYDKSKIIDGKTFLGFDAYIKHRKNFHYLYKQFYVGGRLSTGNRISGATKIIKQSVLNRLNELSVAIWYMDDGSLHTYKRGNNIYRSLSLHTDCFTYQECELIVGFFMDKYGIEFNINKNGMTTDKNRGFKLRTSKRQNIENFMDTVRFFVEDVKCMNYKLPY